MGRSSEIIQGVSLGWSVIKREREYAINYTRDLLSMENRGTREDPSLYVSFILKAIEKYCEYE